MVQRPAPVTSGTAPDSQPPLAGTQIVGHREQFACLVHRYRHRHAENIGNGKRDHCGGRCNRKHDVLDTHTPGRTGRSRLYAAFRRRHRNLPHLDYRSMLRLTEIRLGLEHTEAELRAAMLRALGIAEAELVAWHVRRRGYDARRSGEIVFVYTLDVEVRDEAALLAKLHGRPHVTRAPDETYRYPVRAPAGLAKQPVVIGTGPCGIFAGLSLARMGFRPIILERGRIVRERTHDVWGFWRERRLNPESNVQFGEGGAGTFSDGKLHTGIKDRGYRIRQILKDFVDCGAPAEIIYISKPHIGTLRLVKVVENLRHRIEELGGEIRFEARVTDIAIENGAVRGVTLANGAHIETDRVVLAVGHSARYLRDAARPGRAHRGEAVLHRLPHRAPAGPDQPLPPRAARRQSGARRRRLQTRAPRHQRPLGVQLLHVPRRGRWWPRRRKPGAWSRTA